MMEVIKRFTKDGKYLEIVRDPDPTNPREDDCGTTMLCLHRRYNLGDRQNISMEEILEEAAKSVVLRDIYMYDHGGVTISTTPFSCVWDSGKVGIIFMTDKQVKEVFPGVPEAEALKRAGELLEGCVEAYDQYLRGDVYGFVCGTVEHCDKCGNIEDNEVDSCWGFYGDNPISNGMYDHISQEYRELLKDLYGEEIKKYEEANKKRG